MPIRWAHRDTPGLLLNTASAQNGTATRFEQGGRGLCSLKAAKGIPRRDTEEIAEPRISRGRMRAILRFYTTCTFLSEFEIMWETGEVDFEPITTRV